jgi:hypothetical protein
VIFFLHEMGILENELQCHLQRMDLRYLFVGVIECLREDDLLVVEISGIFGYLILS